MSDPLPPNQPIAPGPAQPVTPGSVMPAPEQPKRGGSKALLIIIIVLLIAGAATLVAIYIVKLHAKPAGVVKKDIPYLTYGSDETADLTQLYPTETVDTDTSTQVNAQLFEGLVRYQRTTKIVPLLAASWYNPDNTTWVFNLRHDVKFHSGRTMTATDVKYSLDYAVAHQNDYSGATLMALASSIKQVDVTGPYQVKITTDGPDPVLLNRLPYLYILDSKATIGDPNSGTGPYIVKPGAKPTTNAIDLAAFDGYWGGHVYTRAVHVEVTASGDQLATDTGKGKFDIAGDFTNQQLTKIKNYQPIVIQDLGITFLGLNTLKAGSPLRSLAARQAATYALNIPAILKAGSLNGIKASQLVPPAIPGYDPSIHTAQYNPTKAKQLLATVPDAAAPLTLSYPAGDDGQVAEIAKELNAVGFDVKVASVTDLDTLVNQAYGGQTDIFYLAYSSATLDGLDILNSIVTAANQDYDTATVAGLSDQAGATLDPTTRISILQKIARQVASDIPDIPLYTQTRTVTLSKPYHVQVDIPSIETGVYFWQVYQQ